MIQSQKINKQTENSKKISTTPNASTQGKTDSTEKNEKKKKRDLYFRKFLYIQNEALTTFRNNIDKTWYNIFEFVPKDVRLWPLIGVNKYITSVTLTYYEKTPERCLKFLEEPKTSYFWKEFNMPNIDLSNLKEFSFLKYISKKIIRVKLKK